MKLRDWILAVVFLWALCSVALGPNPNIETAGNIYMVGDRTFESPTKIFMGETYDAGLYLAVQPREDGSLFSVMETFCRPAKGVAVAEGYGCGPLRIWGEEVLIEEDGTAVFGGSVVTNKIVLQEPNTTNFGGITWDTESLGTYITLDKAGDIVACKNYLCTALTQ